MAHIHREPYINLSGLTEESALITWGAFFFEVTGDEVRTDPLEDGAKANNVAWSATPHFLLCEYTGGSLNVTPYGELKDGEVKPLKNVKDPQGKTVKLPFVVKLT